LDKFFSKVQDWMYSSSCTRSASRHGERLKDHYFNNVDRQPVETTVAASHLIFDGVMERFPKLKIVLPHGGGSTFAHYWARMDHAQRARPDCRVHNKKETFQLPGEVLLRQHHLRSGMLRHLVERFGADHVLLGTDYPTTWAWRTRWDSSVQSRSCLLFRKNRSWEATPPAC